MELNNPLNVYFQEKKNPTHRQKIKECCVNEYSVYVDWEITKADIFPIIETLKFDGDSKNAANDPIFAALK